MQHRIELHHKPLGVVGSIVPWNFPLMIAIWHIISALKAGNTVVIKPSPLAPLSVIKLVELINEVLPAGVVNLVTGDDNIGEAITQHLDIARIVFTGFTNTGKRIMANSATTLKRLTLELGGNDAAILLPDVDPLSVAETIFHTAFVNSGQTCAALKRLYVHESIYDQICDALVNLASQFKVGNGLEEGVMFGPIQNKQQYQRVCQLAEDTKKEGGRFLTGGESMPGPGYFFPITLVADISDGSRLVDEEPFEPILPIIKYSDVEYAIARANQNNCGLGGSVWSKNTE
ncbi:MAG: aldehyde dehydrogenase family protein, partial [Pseudomonadales bacterium]|nr:aldehyde dehydrogenase family protein [Pseudomonadales bacterium]